MTTKKILYFDMDNVLVDFPSAFSKVDPKLLDEFEGRLDEIPGIFSLMEPLEGDSEWVRGPRYPALNIEVAVL